MKHFLFVALISATVSANAAQPCADLSKFTSAEHQIVIRTASDVPASAPGSAPSLPAHCRVEGVIDARTGRDGKPYGIGFALALPADWNGRFLFQGGGGLNGSVQPPLGAQFAGERPALARGFAVASTDSGHQGAGFDGSFLRDQQATVNFLYQGVATVTVIAKQLVAQRYGKAPDHSYFVGCSTGGREAMMMSQRFPMLFRRHRGGGSGDAHQLLEPRLAARDHCAQCHRARETRDGQRDTRAALSDADRKLVVDRVLEACDALDGNRDGFIFAPQACRFDPATLACKGSKKDGCLTSAQVKAIRSVMQGPRTPSGRQVYPGYYFDTGIANTQGLPGILAGPMIPEGRPVGVTLDVDAAAAEAMDARAMAGDSNAWTNLSTFRGHGGKLIFLHGVSDPWFSAQDTVQYYERLGQDNGEEPLTEWSRLFLVPGMGHCGGGERTLDRVDLLDALVSWVEEQSRPRTRDRHRIVGARREPAAVSVSVARAVLGDRRCARRG